MAATSRCIPIARLRVYPNAGRGYSNDPGWAWHSPMSTDADEWYADYGYPYDCDVGTPSIQAFTTLTLGLHTLTIPTPLWYPWHTEIDQWAQDSGTWEERVIFAGPLALTALWNLENSGQLTAAWCHPEAPNFVIQFLPMATPEEWDANANPPYLSVKWGQNPPAVAADRQYELRLWNDGSLFVGCHYSDGSYQHLSLGNIGWAWPEMGQEPQPISLMVLHVAGGIAIRPSTGGGQWLFYSDPEEAIWPAADNTNQIEVSYQGGQAVFGFHGVAGPVDAPAETLTDLLSYSPVRVAERVRAGLPTVYSRTEVPAVAAEIVAAALDITNIDLSGTDEVQMLAEWVWGYAAATDCAGTPIAAQTDIPFSYRFPYFPELYAAGQYFAPDVEAPAGAAAEIYTESIEAIDVFLLDEGDVSHANCRAYWDIQDSGAFADALYMRLVDLAIGWKYDDDSTALTEQITGVVTEVDIVQRDFGRLRVEFRITDTSTPLRQVECDDSWPVMDGWNAQTAAAHVCEKMGWHSTLYNFASMAACDLTIGRPDYPLWQAQPGMQAWDFLERIARFCEQEVAVAAGGGIYTRDMCYFDVGTVHAITSLQVRKMPPPRAERRHAYSYTGVEVQGADYAGNRISAWEADTDMEDNPAYAYFCGYRRLERFDESGCNTQALCDAMALALYTLMRYRVADQIIWQTDYRSADPWPNGWETVWRRDCCFIDGLSIGITALDLLGIITLQHHWGPRQKDCFTEWVAIPYGEVGE